MRFLLDTNVIVYALNRKSAYNEEVLSFLFGCQAKNATCYFVSSSLKDAYYVLSKHYALEKDARAAIKCFRECFDMVSLTDGIIDGAFESNEPDFEDAIVRVVAEALQVDAIVSYDVKAFTNSFVPKFTAREAADRFLCEA